MWSAWGRRSGVIDGKKSVPVLRRENAVTSGRAHITRSARRRQLRDLPMRLPAKGRRWRRGRAHRGSARRKALRHGRRRAEHRGGARREQFERQDPALNAGRWTLDASLPAADPFPDSSVYSLAHRNPHGIAWDRDGRRQATEFGENTWHKFTTITAGANDGWPIVEGIGSGTALVDPLYAWLANEADRTAAGFYSVPFGRIREDDRNLQTELVPTSGAVTSGVTPAG